MAEAILANGLGKNKKHPIASRFNSDQTNESKKKNPLMKSLTQVRLNNVWKLPSGSSSSAPTHCL